MQRYFIDGPLLAPIKIFPTDEFHLKTVMRAHLGTQIEVVADGHLYLLEVTCMQPLDFKVIRELRENSEPDIHVTLIFSLAKGEKIDWVIQKATELGVARIILAESMRSVVKIKPDRNRHKQDRYGIIAKEAAEQSHRLQRPEIIGPLPLASAISKVDGFCLVADLFLEQSLSPDSALRQARQEKKVTVAIGPEGGFAPEEKEMLREHHFLPLSLGRRVLRTETAALMAVATFTVMNEVEL